jgi:hypothetical protein
MSDWLVWDANGRLWWKQDGKGYTRHLREAGRFTESDAIRHQMSSDLTAERHDIAIPLSALTSGVFSEQLSAALKLTVSALKTIRRRLQAPSDDSQRAAVERLDQIIATGERAMRGDLA